MQKVVKIRHIGETKKGVSQTTGQDWALTDVVVQWTVAQPGTEPYTQECLGTVRGWINRDVVQQYLREGTEITVTVYFGTRLWNNKVFNKIDIYLPKSMMLEAEPL